MSTEQLKLKIEPSTREILPGRGFYQIDEDTLYVQIAQFDLEHRYFSQIKSEVVRLDLDRHGRLLFVEVSKPRTEWPAQKNMPKHGKLTSAEVKWLDFRTEINDPEIITNKDASEICLVFADKRDKKTIQLADSVVISISAENCLNRIWVSDIEDDNGGHKMAKYRKLCRGENESD